MKRKLTQTTSVVLVLLVLMGCFFISPSVGAATYGDWEYTLQDDFTCIITKYKGSAKNVTVPSTIYGNPVLSIASAFIDNKSIQSVTISKGIRKIDRYHIYGGTFDGCSNLKSVIIPNTVESIGYWTFRGCSSLESITIPGSVNTIEGYAFEGCTKLKTIKFNEGLKEIQEHAFGNCHSLTQLVLPNTLERIGGLAFVGCSGLQTISIGSNLSYIPDDNNAFMPWNGYTGTSSLVSITVNANNGYFCSENGILYNKNKTKLVLYPQAKNDKVYVMPSTVSEIVSNSLIYNPYMSEISIPKNIKKIGKEIGYTKNSTTDYFDFAETEITKKG